MQQKLFYTSPCTECVLLRPEQRILALSSYGNSGEPGTGFGDGDIIDNPVLF